MCISNKCGCCWARNHTLRTTAIVEGILWWEGPQRGEEGFSKGNGENPVSKEGVKCLLILEGKRGLWGWDLRKIVWKKGLGALGFQGGGERCLSRIFTRKHRGSWGTSLENVGGLWRDNRKRGPPEKGLWVYFRGKRMEKWDGVNRNSKARG